MTSRPAPWPEPPSPSAALLQLARAKADLTQQELADRAGVPRSMVSTYERGLREPTMATMLRLLRAAGSDLQMHLIPYVPEDDPELERGRRTKKPSSACSTVMESTTS